MIEASAVIIVTATIESKNEATTAPSVEAADLMTEAIFRFARPAIARRLIRLARL
jgi:hypothetical protein